MKTPPPFEPTPIRIRLLCRHFQRHWTEAQRRQRRIAAGYHPVETPELPDPMPEHQRRKEEL